MKTLGLLVAVLFAYAAASAEAESGLAGLDAQLNGTGKIGVLAPRFENQVAAGPLGEVRPRAEQPRVGHANNQVDGPPAQTEALGDAELRQTEGRVSGCRIEVARRRQVAPAKVAAGSVLLRFVVEPNGRVHDAEAVSAKDTNHEVAACAKRILSEWAFGKHAGTAVVVEHSYQFDDRLPAGSAAAVSR